MKQDINDLRFAGEIIARDRCIFQEVAANGTPCNHYITLNAGQVLPATKSERGYWRTRTIYDLHAGIS